MTVGLVAGKGRGLVVTQNVKAGQLLFVHKPLAIAHVNARELGFQIDMHTRRMVSMLLADSLLDVHLPVPKFCNAT